MLPWAARHLALTGPPSGRNDTAVGSASADADLTVAISIYFVVVVLTALLGTPAAITGMVASYLAFNFWFIPPRGSLLLDRVDYVAPLIGFVVAAAACSVVVTRLNSMRHT